MNPTDVQPDPNVKGRLAGHLAGLRLGFPLHAYGQVSSTMDRAHELARSGAPEGTLVWAARQGQGRGRLGRTWVSPEGGLYVSLVLRPTRPVAEVPQLSLVAGLAAAEAIHELTRLFPAIRWPNDLLLNDRKICGILVETVEGAVSVGVGINVSTPAAGLPETATSLAAAGATACDSLQLTGVLCRHLQAWYDLWSTQGFAPVRTALRPWMGLFGRPVHIVAGSDRFEGTASDLDEAGRLVVRLDAGVLRAFDMGEVSVLRAHGGAEA